MFINELLCEVEQVGLGTELNGGGKIGGLLFADDFVGVTNSDDKLHKCGVCKMEVKG